MQSERLFIGLLWPTKPTAHLYLKSLKSPKNESCIEFVCFVCSGEGRSGGMVTIPGGLDLTANNRDGTGETDGLLVKSTPSSKATTSGTSNLGGGGVGGGGNSSGNSNGGSRAHRSLHWLYLFCWLFVKEIIDLLGGLQELQRFKDRFWPRPQGTPSITTNANPNCVFVKNTLFTTDPWFCNEATE